MNLEWMNCPHNGSYRGSTDLTPPDECRPLCLLRREVATVTPRIAASGDDHLVLKTPKRLKLLNKHLMHTHPHCFDVAWQPSLVFMQVVASCIEF